MHIEMTHQEIIDLFIRNEDGDRELAREFLRGPSGYAVMCDPAFVRLCVDNAEAMGVAAEKEEPKMKRYHITFTTSTLAGDLDEAISIAIDQIADGSAHMEMEEEEIEEEADSTDQQSLEDRKLNATLAVLFMGLETADDSEAAYKEIMQAVADAGKDPMYVMDWLVNLGKGR
jgi:hypothetical protein